MTMGTYVSKDFSGMGLVRGILDGDGGFSPFLGDVHRNVSAFLPEPAGDLARLVEAEGIAWRRIEGTGENEPPSEEELIFGALITARDFLELFLKSRETAMRLVRGLHDGA